MRNKPRSNANTIGREQPKEGSEFAITNTFAFSCRFSVAHQIIILSSSLKCAKAESVRNKNKKRRILCFSIRAVWPFIWRRSLWWWYTFAVFRQRRLFEQQCVCVQANAAVSFDLWKQHLTNCFHNCSWAITDLFLPGASSATINQRWPKQRSKKRKANATLIQTTRTRPKSKRHS